MTGSAKVVATLRQSFSKEKTKSVEWRKKQLEALDRMLVENDDVFAEALKEDLNRHYQDCVLTAAGFLRNDIISAIRNIDEWTADQHVSRSLITLLDKPYIHPEPLGVVLIIGAWNYPLQLTLAPLIPAIAAGNCAVLKPSEISPATASAIAELIPKYLDSQCFQVVTGGVPETTELLENKFDHIFYTGSSTVGKIIASTAAKTLTPCTLELGGKSPAFVDDCPNMERAVKRLLWGKFQNAGQICVAPDYILCTKKVETRLVPMMKKILNDWHGKNPSNMEHYGKIVSARHFERLQGLLEKTKGTIAIGGNMDEDKLFMDTTVITGVKMSDATMKEEIFGPILPIITIESVEEAIDLITSRDKPLALYVFSEREGVIRQFKERTSSGGLTINETLMQLSVEELPFGGVGNSGYGAYHGKYGFDTFTHYKPVLERNMGWAMEKLTEFRYPPYDPKNLPFIKIVTKNREMPSVTLIKYLLLLLAGAAIGSAVSLALVKQ